MKTQARSRTIGAKHLGREYQLRAVERVMPETFNPAAGRIMPRLWQIEVTEGLPCEFENVEFSTTGFSSKEAEASLLGCLRMANIHGVVRIKRDKAA